MALKTYTWETGDYAYQSWSNGYKIHLTLTEESTSTANNTSLVSYKFWVSNGSNARFYDNNWSWSISIGGQTIAINNFNFYVYPYNVTQIIASGQITVTHNSDGSLNMPYNVSVPNVKASNQYGMPAMALSGTWALTSIPRQATVTSAASFTDENNPIVYYSNPAGNAVTSLQACIANDTGGVQYAKYRDIPKTGSSYQFVLTTEERIALYNASSNSNTLAVRFYVKSVIGGTTYTSSLPATLSIVNANPVVSVSAVDTNETTIALTGNNKKFVKFYSNVEVTATATAQKGATITSTTGTGTYSNVKTNSWAVEATDSRGNKTKKTASGTLISYTLIESVMPSSHLILCRPLLLLLPIPPSIRVFSNESTLCMRWPKYWSFSFSIIPSKEIPGLISFRMDWLDLLAVQGTLKSLLQHHSSKASILWCSAFFTVQLSHPYMTTGKTIALTRRTFVDKVTSLLFNILSRLVITFLPRSKRLLISWLQSPSAVILEPPQNKV